MRIVSAGETASAPAESRPPSCEGLTEPDSADAQVLGMTWKLEDRPRFPTAPPVVPEGRSRPRLMGWISLADARCNAAQSDHSHSMVAGGLPDMSYTTRLMPRTSLVMRVDTVASKACGSGAQCAVMKSVVCTARSATACS